MNLILIALVAVFMPLTIFFLIKFCKKVDRNIYGEDYEFEPNVKPLGPISMLTKYSMEVQNRDYWDWE